MPGHGGPRVLTAPADEDEVFTTCPRDCYDACSISVVRRRTGGLLVRGDPRDFVSRGKLCRKCATAYNGVLLDPAARLGAPLRRTGAKGSADFEETTWEDAVSEIAARLSRIAAEHGPATVLNAHYTGTFGMIGYYFPLRFFNRLGATEVDPDSVCNKAGHVALEYVYGTSLDGFDPRTARDAASIVVWGANPSASAPHQHEHWLSEAECPVIVVDPLRTETAKKADLHLQAAPGTDAVLAFSLMHVLAQEGAIDRAFVSAYCVGFEQLEPLLADWSPERAEEVTAVPAGEIVRAGRMLAGGPSLLWIGQGLQRQPTGGNIVRAVSLLPALTGSLGRPGGGFLYLNGVGTRGVDEDSLSASHLAPERRQLVSQMDLASVLEDPVRARALFCWNINIAASNPEQARLKAALRREDLFTVVADLFMTDTADLADFVLPAASFLEHDDLVLSYFHHSIGAQVAVTSALGEARSNSAIFRQLSEAMGYRDPELFETDRDVIDGLLRETGIDISFEELASRGRTFLADEPRIQFEDLHFPTPSGKVEISSMLAERDGFSRLPLPLSDPPAREGRLRLLSPATAWTLNDSYGNDAGIRRRLGEQSVALHPEEATRRGLVPGELVSVQSETGQLTLPLVTTSDVPHGVAVIPKGRWPKLEAERANVNVLNPGDKADMGESTAVHGIEVVVERASSRADGGRESRERG